MTEEATDGAPFSGAPTLDANAPGVPAPPSPLPAGIGGYRVVRKLGEGGMGIVYEADQPSPKRRVALKVVRGGQFVDETYLRMFRREAETLARLVHPNIAAIYEAGRTEDGQHFFTMELVTGETLSAYARRRLGGEKPGPGEVRGRVRLFETVCRAVNHAHQRGVIHRDLKPSNIVVSESGEVKVLDFGLARITDADVAVGTVMTELGKIWGTLPYMSPEQTRGDSRGIDFRSDVYSLGVVLYELVSGRLPYDTQTGSLVQAVRTICEEPPQPLTATAADADLKAIVGKALEKDPDQRYQTAAALAEDVARWLAGQPVLAHPPSTMYQLRKLAARHKGSVAAASTIAVLLVSLAVTMAVQAGRVRRERDRAAAEAAKATAINAFLEDALGAADAWGKGSKNVTLLEALKQARTKVETSFSGQPRVEAAVLRTIGTTLANLAELEEAEPSLKRALELAESAAGRESAEAADSHQALSSLYEMWRRFDEAERHGRRAWEINRAIHGPESLEAAWSILDVSAPVRKKGRLDEAKALAEEMRRIARLHAGSAGTRADDAARVEEEALAELCHVASEGPDRAVYEALVVEKLERYRRRFPGPHPFVATALNDLAVVRMLKQDLAGAEALFREAIAMHVATLGPDHPEVATSLENLANVSFRQGRYDESSKSLQTVLEMRRRVLGDGSEPVARTLANIGSVRRKAGQLDAAGDALEEAARRFEKILGPEHPDLGTVLFGLGDTRRLQKRFDEAETTFRRALAIRTKAFGEGDATAQRILKALSLLSADQGRPAKAAEYAARIAPEAAPAK